MISYDSIGMKRLQKVVNTLKFKRFVFAESGDLFQTIMYLFIKKVDYSIDLKDIDILTIY